MSMSAMNRREFIATTGSAVASAVFASQALASEAPAADTEEAKGMLPPSGEAEPTEWAFTSPDGFVPPAPVVCDDVRAKPLPEWIFGEPAGKLEGKIAVVTGASSGIGREIARTFAREGAKVVAVARRMERLLALSEESLDYAGEIAAYKADLSDAGQVQQAIDFALETYGRIDILVNNAAITGNWGKAGTYILGEYNYTLALNTVAPLVAIDRALPGMIEQGGGRIINIGSMAGIDARSAGVDYVSSKFALRAITQNTAFHYGSKGIRCNAICPGGTDTEIGLAQAPIDQECLDMAMAWYAGIGQAAQTYAQPEQVAAFALFLALPEADGINGSMLMHDDARAMH